MSQKLKGEIKSWDLVIAFKMRYSVAWHLELTQKAHLRLVLKRHIIFLVFWWRICTQNFSFVLALLLLLIGTHTSYCNWREHSILLAVNYKKDLIFLATYMRIIFFRVNTVSATYGTTNVILSLKTTFGNQRFLISVIYIFNRNVCMIILCVLLVRAKVISRN